MYTQLVHPDTHLYTYIPTYIYMHTTYIHTYIHACMHTYTCILHTYIPTYIYMHTTYMATYIHHLHTISIARHITYTHLQKTVAHDPGYHGNTATPYVPWLQHLHPCQIPMKIRQWKINQRSCLLLPLCANSCVVTRLTH